MIQTLTTPATTAPAPAETPAERVERQARGLREMQAIILSIARAEEQVALARAAQAMNAAEAGLAPAAGSRVAQKDGADPGLAISRIARTLLLTQAMENRLYDDLAAEPKRKPEPPAAAAFLGQLKPRTEDERREAAGVRGYILSSTILPVVEQAIQDAEDPKGDGSDTERRLDHLDRAAAGPRRDRQLRHPAHQRPPSPGSAHISAWTPGLEPLGRRGLGHRGSRSRRAGLALWAGVGGGRGSGRWRWGAEGGRTDRKGRCPTRRREAVRASTRRPVGRRLSLTRGFAIPSHRHPEPAAKRARRRAHGRPLALRVTLGPASFTPPSPRSAARSRPGSLP